MGRLAGAPRCKAFQQFAYQKVHDHSGRSSAAPISMAPPAAIVIKASIENGDPVMAAANARRAIGTRPMARATMKA